MKSGLLFLLIFFTCLLNGQSADQDTDGGVVDSLIELAMNQISERLLNEAMQTLNTAKKIAIESFGEDHPKYSDCVYQEGRIYYFQNQSEEAEKAFLKAISIRQKKLGSDHPDLAAVLRNLGILYSRMGQYPKADSVYQIAKSIHEKQKEVDPLAYANILNNLAILYVRTGRFSEAEQYYDEVLELRGVELGKDDPLYIGTLNNIGSMYYRWGQFEEAEEEYLKVKKWQAENLGKDHIQYARLLSNMANLYTDMGRYEEAERFYTEILKWQEQNLGNDSEDYGFTLGYLGLLCIDLGRYEEAGRYLRESVKVVGDIFGKDHFEYAYSLDYLAGFYHTMGLLEEAEKLYQESKNIREKVLGKQHEDYGRALNNLAILYADMDQDDQAETLYKEAKDVFSEAGKESTDYIWTLNNLAILYKNQGRYEPAKSYLQEASLLWEKALGKSHSNYANSLEDLALVLQQTGDLKKAIGLQEEAHQIFANALGVNHLRYAQSSSYLAGMYNATGRVQEALPLLLKANEIHNQQLTEATRHLSQRDLPKYIRLFESYLQKFYAFTSEHHDEMPQLADASFENALFHKGFVLMAANQIGRLAKSDPVASKQFEQLQSYHRRIAWEMAKPVEERQALPKLRNTANELERKLVSQVKNLGEAVHQVTIAELEETLGDQDIIIEFIDYQIEEKSDSVQYAALVLKKDGFGSKNRCHFVPLCMEASLQSLLKINTNRQADYVNTLYGVSRRGASPIGENEPSLYELIWVPLEKVLNEIGLAEGEKLNIYFSPSGLLNRLNIAAIPIDRRTQLADRYNLVRLGSSRSLVQKMESASKVEKAVLYGGLEYELDEQRLAQLTDDETTPLMAMRNLTSALSENDTLTRAYRGGTWRYLEWSADEVEDINSVLKEKGVASKTIKEWDGTESSLKLMGTKEPSPQIIHLATHGFFFPDPSPKSGQRLNIDAEGGTVFKLSEDPMMRSGLIMSGGGYFWNQPKKRSPEGEDGILTAYEVSQMDLSSTELVVLSACETGLGDIVGDEGVYGLQRAFKIAGAKHLIISLWEVPDRETKDFMITFYEHWVGEGLPIKEAFQKTQRKIKDRFYDPYTWAGFILVE